MVNKYTFNKQATSIDEQVDLLQKRGLIISTDEVDELKTWLSNVTYYKLSGYWFVFEEKHCGVAGRSSRFVPNTLWKKIKHTYIFDQKLRRLIWTGIEKIEISVKAHWSQYLGTAYGAHAHENPELFVSDVFNSSNDNPCMYDKLRSNYHRSNALYAKHYRDKYRNLDTPPIWVVSLIVSFGEVVNWIRFLAAAKDRNAIFKDFGFDERVMIPFLIHLNEVRNICAHNGRLWNRKIVKRFSPPKKIAQKFHYINISEDKTIPSAKLYNTIIMMDELLKTIDPNYPFLRFIRDLIKDNYLIDTNYMSFPSNWENLPPWNSLSPWRPRTNHNHQ